MCRGTDRPNRQRCLLGSRIVLQNRYRDCRDHRGMNRIIHCFRPGGWFSNRHGHLADICLAITIRHHVCKCIRSHKGGVWRIGCCIILVFHDRALSRTANAGQLQGRPRCRLIV